MAQHHDIFNSKEERLKNKFYEQEKARLQKEDEANLQAKSRKKVSVRSHSLGNRNAFLRYLTTAQVLTSSFFDVRYK
jgi:hypothetical protein